MIVAAAAAVLVLLIPGKEAFATGAELKEPGFSCSSTRASVTFNWRPVPGGTSQWIDLSLKDNGFERGTFMTEGPINASQTSYVWDGIQSGEVHFWRLNTLTADGWVTSETGTFVPCNETARGAIFRFGTNVSATDQAAVRDMIRTSAALSRRLLNFEATTYTVHAYEDLGEIATAYAYWVEDPAPDTIEFARRLFGRGSIVGLVSYGDGMFIPTFTNAWKRSSNYRYLVLGHEYMHLVQTALRETPERRGTPLWLSEGSAELFGILVYCARTSTDFSTLRNAYIRSVDGVTESLVGLEAGGRFSQVAEDSYPLAMLAFEYLILQRGWPGYVDYYRAIGANVEWHQAFTQSFGVPYDSFAASFENYRVNGYR